MTAVLTFDYTVFLSERQRWNWLSTFSECAATTGRSKAILLDDVCHVGFQFILCIIWYLSFCKRTGDLQLGHPIFIAAECALQLLKMYELRPFKFHETIFNSNSLLIVVWLKPSTFKVLGFSPCL